jgi:hypothetical protein
VGNDSAAAVAAAARPHVVALAGAGASHVQLGDAAWEGRGHGATAELVMGGSRGARSLAAAPACGARTQPLGRVLATHVEGTHLMSVSLQHAGMELAKLYWASISNDLNTKLNGFATQAAAGMLCSARRGGRGRSWRRHSGAGSSASRQHRQPQAPNQA